MGLKEGIKGNNILENQEMQDLSLEIRGFRAIFTLALYKI